MNTAAVLRTRLSPVQAKVLVVSAIVALAAIYLVTTAIQQTSIYYLTIQELRTQGPSTQYVRVSGHVTPGSIQKEDAGLAVRFTVYDPATPDVAPLPVFYSGRGGVPDIFGDDVQVVVEGRYNPDGTFSAHNLLAKCPSRFETAADGQPDS